MENSWNKAATRPNQFLKYDFIRRVLHREVISPGISICYILEMLWLWMCWILKLSIGFPYVQHISYYVCMILHFSDAKHLKVVFDNGTNNVRNVLDLTSCNLCKAQELALVRLHVFSGNNHILSNFWKGKKSFVR